MWFSAAATLSNLFLEQPWPVMIGLFCVGGTFWAVGRRRREKRTARAGLVAVLLAGGVYVLSAVVVTDREWVMAQTQKLVAATDPLDMDQVTALIEPYAQLVGPDGDVWLTFEQVRALLPQTIERFEIGEQRLRQLQAQVVAPGRAVTAIDLRTEVQTLGMPVNSAWVLNWQRDPAGTWRVVEMRWTALQGQTPREGMWR